MAVVYIWRVVESAYFREAAEDQAINEAPLMLLIPTWTVVLLNLYFGFFPALPVELSSSAAEILLGHLP